MIRYVLIILISLAMVSSATAGDQGGTESPFSLGAGARDLSLGGAGLADCQASVAPFWNASRLARAEQYSLCGFHSYLFETDVAYQYLGLAFPTIDFGSFGLGIFRLGVQGIEKRDSLDLYLGDIEDNRLAIYLAYARTLSQYDLGLSIMLEHHSLAGYSATSSPGVNLSASRRFDLDRDKIKSVTAVINARNLIQPQMQLVEESIGYPFTADLGVTVGIKPKQIWNQILNLSAGLQKVNHLDPSLKIGAEYNIEDLLLIRTGFRAGKLSFGVGVNYRVLSFDYALVSRDLGSLHMFTLTTSFGTPVSEKRRARIRKQEAEFDRMMLDRLNSLNREKVSELTTAGRKYLDNGNLTEAGNSFDKALFMARNSGLDTTSISELVNKVQNQLEAQSRDQRYRQYLDSAQIKLAAQDFISARYFAGMAIAEHPGAPEAENILSQANDAIHQLESQEELVNNRLWTADSLLSYGQIDQALNVLNALVEYAPENNTVIKARRKARFEKWRAAASSAYSSEKFESALAALDSALSLYPGHEWCREMKKRIGEEIRLRNQKVVVEEIPKPEPLSPELQKEVAEAYNNGRDMFTRGELAEAIKYWEKVERLAPDYSSVRSYLVNAYKFVGIDLYSRSFFEKAVEVWKKAAVLDPRNEEISGYIRRTEIEIKKLQELSYDK